MTLNVNLTPQLENMVREKVSSGLYTSASEVVREALRLMEEKDQIRAIKLDNLRKDIIEGINSGSSTPLDMQDVIKAAQQQYTASTVTSVS